MTNYQTGSSNIARPTDVVSDAISAALVQRVVLAPLVYSESLPQQTKVKNWRKKGKLVAEQVAEYGSITLSANSQYVETTAASTAVKLACCAELTVETEQFTSMSESQIYTELGQAIARYYDYYIGALFSGSTHSVTCSGAASLPKLLEAIYTCHRYTEGNAAPQLIAVLNYKGIFELKKELALTSATALVSNLKMASILTGATGANGFVGEYPGARIYQTKYVATSGAYDCGMVFDPAIGFGAMVSLTPNFRSFWKGMQQGGVTEFAAWIFADCVLWNDYATCIFKSAT